MDDYPAAGFRCRGNHKEHAFLVQAILTIGLCGNDNSFAFRAGICVVLSNGFRGRRTLCWLGFHPCR